MYTLIQRQYNVEAHADMDILFPYERSYHIVYGYNTAYEPWGI